MIIEEPLIEVVAAEMRIAVRRFHFEDAFAEFENGNIERAAAEVEYGNFPVFVFLVEAVGKSRRRRLVDDAPDVQARQSRPLPSLPGAVRR